MSLYNKFKMWGWRGAMNYLGSRFHVWQEMNAFRKTALPRNSPVETGITVVAALSSQGSVNKAMRDFCFSLKDIGVPFQVFDTGDHSVLPQDIEPILTPVSEFRINRFTHLCEMLSSNVPNGLVHCRGRIVFWEFESGLLEAYPTLVERPGDVLAMSDYNYSYFKTCISGRRKVYKILYPLRMDLSHVLPKSECRRKFDLSQDDFIVFYNFSYASGWNRKNAIGVVEAFAKAFTRVPGAVLVLKTAVKKGHEGRVGQLRQLAIRYGVENKIRFVDDFLSQDDVYNLTNACDVYLSLHRSEGFGLGIAEAMMLGKAVVVTGYSAPLEFCSDENSVLVPYRMVPVECSDVEWYSAAKEWAEPDVSYAASTLRKMFEDPQMVVSLGGRAQASIRERFSTEHFRKSIQDYLSCR